MAEEVSRTITLRYNHNINGESYPAGMSISVPKEVASQLLSNDEVRLKEEIRRMEARPDNIVPAGIDPVTGRPFRN